MLQIPSITTISKNGQIHVESGFPSDSHVIEKEVRQKGTLTINANADIDFTPTASSSCAGPVIKPVAQGEGYHIKRTSRNYLIQVKVPIIESRRETEKKLRDLLPEIVGEITIDRKEMLN